MIPLNGHSIRIFDLGQDSFVSGIDDLETVKQGRS
jgi:hypothetical protein